MKLNAPPTETESANVNATTSNGQIFQWKLRPGPAGLHLFDRVSGLNVLIDEIHFPAAHHARAPRQVSVALTNRCDLACPHCYAPKSPDALAFDVVMRWLKEFDLHGALGVGFGGGEPMLYPHFERLCQQVARETRLSVTFTTHGHFVEDDLAERLRGSVHFIRVSMDGVGATYEAIRGRSFPDLIARLKHVRAISPFGINIVINERTLLDLDEAAAIAMDNGACELLLLPQVAVRGVLAATQRTLLGLRRWVDSYKGPLKLCINDASSDGFPICDPLVKERGLRAYAHIDAAGVLKPSSYHAVGISIGDGSVHQALDQLTQQLSEDDG